MSNELRQAAGRIRKINDDIVSALVRIPRILDKSRRVLAINEASEDLGNYSSALYVAVRHTMGHTLKFSQERAFPRALKALVLQESFQYVLIEMMNAMHECSNAIDGKAKLCHMERAISTNQIATTTNQIVKSCMRLLELSKNRQARSHYSRMISKDQ